MLSGNVLEVYRYQEDIYHNFRQFDLTNKKIPPEELQEDNEKESKENIKERSVKRSKIRLRRLINANANELSKFVTLTFKENIVDISKANGEFKKFKQRLRYRLKKQDRDLKYIAVIEFQERGAVHYHCLMNCGYIPNKVLNQIWGNGFVRINNIENVDNVGAYVVSYMSSEFKDIDDHKRYLHSRNLKKPIVIKNDKRVSELMAAIDSSNLAYETEYETDYFGKVNYRQYKT